MALSDRVLLDELGALRMAAGICAFALHQSELAQPERDLFESILADLARHGQELEKRLDARLRLARGAAFPGALAQLSGGILPGRGPQ